MKKRLPLLFALLCLVGGLVSGEEPEAVRRPFEIRVRTSEMIAVTDSLTIEVALLNTDMDRKQVFTIDDIFVELPAPFVLPGRESKYNLVTEQKPIANFDPGTSVSRSKVIPKVRFSDAPKDCLLFRCTKNQIVIRINFSTRRGESIERGEIAEFVDVRARSNLMAVIAGGIAGVILATLFSLLYRAFVSRNQPRGTGNAGPWWQRLRVSLTMGVITFLYGSLATAVAILLLTLTTVSGFPVSVSVCDSLGGLILGLFFEPVGEFIHSKISSTTSSAI